MIKIDNYTIEASIENILYKVRSELTNGKLKDIKRKAGQVCITCPCHDGGRESTASCFVNDDGVWHCFACQESGNICKLVGACFDEDEKFGKKWLLANYVGDTIIEHESTFLPDDLFEDKKIKVLDESILDSYEEWHPYLAKRHLSPSICKLFKVRYDREKEMIVFPVWDENNRLVMLTRRSVNNKTFLIDKNVEKPVYLLNYILNSGITEVTICESQINALTCLTYGYPAVALFGTGTKYQYDILNKSGIRHYYLAFDGDEAGMKGTLRFLKNIRDDVFVDVLMIPKGKDVNDLTQDEFDSLEIVNSVDWLAKYSK